MGAYADHDCRSSSRGEGCYVFDDHGSRYLDGLSALFCVNLGHGRGDLAQAGADQAKELGYFSTWSYAHPRAIELAAKIASLAPGDLNRVFFTSGGGESVESALKLARQYHKLSGHPNKTKVIAREVAYHGTTLGALSATGITRLRPPFEPFAPGGCHVPNTNLYRLPQGHGAENLAEAVAQRIEFEGPDTVAAVIMEPVQNAGGCLTPPDGYFAAGPRDLRPLRRPADLRRGHLLLGAPGRVVRRAALRLPARHHHDGQGADLRLRADGRDDRVRPPHGAVPRGRHVLPHGFTFGGHPMAAAVALANIAAFEDEGILDHVRAHEAGLRAMLDSLRDIPIVGDVRGAGYFHAVELVKDRDTKATFDAEESETLLRGFLSGELYRRGLICRADDRGDPVVMLAPPLIAGPEQFEEIEAVLRPVLDRGRAPRGRRLTAPC